MKEQEEAPSLASEAAIGARVGVVFAAFEAIAAAWLTRSTVDGLDYVQQSALSFSSSIAVHAALGAVVGALLAKPAARIATRIERPAGEIVARFATLGQLLALAINALTLLPNRAIEIRHTLLLSIGLSLAIVASLSLRRAASWLAGVASPWTCALLCGVVPWLAGHPLAESSWSVKHIAAALFTLAFASIAIWIRGALSSVRTLSWLPVGALAGFALAGGLLPQSHIEAEAIAPPNPKAAGSPNVILISLDTVRADHLSVYGYARDTTPVLREFAKDASVFERSYSTADFTLASHASLFSGLYTREHGARPDPDRWGQAPLANAAHTLTEMLAHSGWQTSAVVANCVLLASSYGFAQGFEHYDARYRPIQFPRAPRWTLRGRLHEWLHDHLPPEEFDLVFRGASEINSEVFEQIANRDADRPLFLFVNYMDAHAPYRPPPPFDTRFAANLEPMRMSGYREKREQLYSATAELPPTEREEYVAHYDGAIAYLDSELGVLFEHLKQKGLYDDALIVITSDHGEAFGEHGTMEHGMSVYQEQVRVPLIVKRPRAHEARTVTQVVGGVDVIPTVLAELGLEVPEGLPGRNLFGPDAPANHVVFSEHYPTAWHTANNKKRAVHSTAAAWGQYVQIRYDDGRCEIYDIVADPGQEHPLDALPPGVPDLCAQLEAWIAVKRTNALRESKGANEALQMLGYGGH